MSLHDRGLQAFSLDNSQERTMTDESQIASWLTFYKQNAELPIFSPRAKVSEPKVKEIVR